MFDTTGLLVVGGAGGNGGISFLREPFNPHGGPDGGDGGNGGCVRIVAVPHQNTLRHLERVRSFRGKDGASGGKRDRKGKRGKDVRIEVPVGTTVWEVDDAGERAMLADLATAGESVVAADGGRYGRGNHRFATPTNQEPLLAEAGEAGGLRFLALEVRLVADVALVGAPNAGKSTLLAAVSRARPKIADYPFTTVEPVLGVVEWKGRRLVVVDVPGLIEGAHEGRGLGLEFMRHASRVRALVQLIDGTEDELIGEYRRVDAELAAYGHGLASKPRVVVVNKADVEGVETRAGSVIELLRSESGATTMVVSAASQAGIPQLLDKLLELTPEEPPSAAAEDLPVGSEAATQVRVEREEGVAVRVEDGVYVVSCRQAERIAPMVRFTNWRARLQFHNELERLGVIAALEKAGAASGDTVSIAGRELEWD